MADFIQLKKDSILRIGIKDSEGNDTGEHLEFDLEDIELPLKVSECEMKHKKNVEYLKMQFTIIEKKEDKKGNKKGKFLLSWKEQEKIKLVKEFYEREMEALDLFLGKDGCKKLLNGRNPYISMYDDINDMLEPIIPKLKVRTDDIKNKIVSKYGNNKENGVLE